MSSSYGRRSGRRVDVQLRQQGRLRSLPMERDALGYHRVIVEDVAAGDTYFYRLDDSQERPDPASRYQPEGVHGPSRSCRPLRLSLDRR